MSDSLSDFLGESEFADNAFDGGDDLFSVFESLESVTDFPPVTPLDEAEDTMRLISQKSTSSAALHEYCETELEVSPKIKRQKVASTTSSEEANPDGQQRISHITVERNRRKQMNEHLSVLRSIMPCFYVKRVSYKFSFPFFPCLTKTYYHNYIYLSNLLKWLYGRKSSQVTQVCFRCFSWNLDSLNALSWLPIWPKLFLLE